MEFLGVLGEKLPHTYSPIINKRIMELINVEGAYKKFELPQGNMHKFIDGVKTLDIRGFNITIPYKEEVIPFLDYISDEAKMKELQDKHKEIYDASIKVKEAISTESKLPDNIKVLLTNNACKEGINILVQALK